MTYSEKLKDPRWQKKRLEILNRDNFECKHCGSKEKTLHVHHTYYGRNLDPWEAENKWLVTLCFECHEEEKQSFQDKADDFITFLKQSGKTSWDLDPILYYIKETYLD